MRYLDFQVTVLMVFSAFCPNLSFAEPIKHEANYPSGNGPFPAVITLHTSGGVAATKRWVENFKSHVWTEAGYVVYSPNFFDRHGITPRTRMDTFTVYREKIETELSKIVDLS